MKNTYNELQVRNQDEMKQYDCKKDSKPHPPTGISHLDAGLADVDGNDLSHGDSIYENPLLSSKPLVEHQS